MRWVLIDARIVLLLATVPKELVADRRSIALIMILSLHVWLEGLSASRSWVPSLRLFSSQRAQGREGTISKLACAFIPQKRVDSTFLHLRDVSTKRT